MTRSLPQSVDEASRPLPVLLRHSWYALNQAFRRRLAHLELTPDQFTVLRNLFECPGLTQSELCSRMASDPNTVAALTARMAKEGWIERKVCAKDRRANRLRLMMPGRKKFMTARRIAVQLQDEVAGSFTEAEREALHRALTKLAKSCQAALQQSPAPSEKRGAREGSPSPQITD